MYRVQIQATLGKVLKGVLVAGALERVPPFNVLRWASLLARPGVQEETQYLRSAGETTLEYVTRSKDA